MRVDKPFLNIIRTLHTVTRGGGGKAVCKHFMDTTSVDMTRGGGSRLFV